jgi:hypothetical protein
MQWVGGPCPAWEDSGLVLRWTARFPDVQYIRCCFSGICMPFLLFAAAASSEDCATYVTSLCWQLCAASPILAAGTKAPEDIIMFTFWEQCSSQLLPALR